MSHGFSSSPTTATWCEMESRSVAKNRQEHAQGRTLKLVLIKLAHTLIWAFFAGCILAIPAASLWRKLDWALALSAAVLVECGIIAVNRGRCPLTNMAARFTDERADNFDIYLPLWLARHNKTIFGALFMAGEAVLLGCWLKR